MKESQTDPKSSTLAASAHTYCWYCPWLPSDYAIRDICRVQSDYQRRIVRLMVAQAVVFYASSATQFLPDDCQASFRFIPASRALSLAGLLTQLVFYYGIPSHLKAFTLTEPEENRTRAIVFFASLWLPLLPFMLSIILLCFSTNHAACIPIDWRALSANVPWLHNSYLLLL